MGLKGTMHSQFGKHFGEFKFCQLVVQNPNVAAISSCEHFFFSLISKKHALQRYWLPIAF